MLVGVHKGGNKRFFAQGDDLGGAVLLGQGIAYVHDFSLVFYEIADDVIILVDRQDMAFVAFHSVPSPSGAVR